LQREKRGSRHVPLERPFALKAIEVLDQALLIARPWKLRRAIDETLRWI
jgi:hypothetical protein